MRKERYILMFSHLFIVSFPCTTPWRTIIIIFSSLPHLIWGRKTQISQFHEIHCIWKKNSFYFWLKLCGIEIKIFSHFDTMYWETIFQHYMYFFLQVFSNIFLPQFILPFLKLHKAWLRLQRMYFTKDELSIIVYYFTWSFGCYVCTDRCQMMFFSY